jgi:acetolactate synthase-1/2/3 large subunit
MTASGYRKETPENEKWIKWCNDINLKYSSLRDITKGKKLNPYVFFDDFFKLLPEGQITVCSNGSACVIPFQTAKIKSGQRLFSNSGCASMGYGLPASIGACVASGNKKTVCLEGDGSIQMNIQELQTIIQNKLPIKIFIINNNGYHSIRQTQANFFKSHFVGVDNRSGVSFPDFKKIAKAYGLQFFWIDSENGVKTNIKKAMEFDLPVICEVVVDYEQQFMPKSSSKILPDGRMISAPLQDMYPFLEETEMQQNKFTSDRG